MGSIKGFMENERETPPVRPVEEHFLYTQSSVAKKVLDEWEETLPKFTKIYPRDYRRIIEERKKKKQDELLVEVA